MSNPLTHTINTQDTDISSYDFDTLLRLMAKELGYPAIAEWLHSMFPKHSVAEFLSSYEGGVELWWGMGSVFLYELALIPSIKIDTNENKIYVTIE